MTKRQLYLSTAIALATALPASAAVTIDVTEDTTGVTFAYSGSLDLTGLTLEQTSSGTFRPIDNRGILDSVDGRYDLYRTITPLGRFTTLRYGEKVGTTTGSSFASGDDFVAVEAGYSSGDAINDSLFFAGETFSSLSLVIRSYTATLPNDTISMIIAEAPIPVPAPIPLPASGMLLLGAVAGIGLAKRRR